MVQHRRSMFDDLLVRINRRVPGALPEEMRNEICQAMLFDVVESVKRILDRSQDYIRQYKKEYPFQMLSLDADNRLAETLVG